jgi:hypothetical protein
MTHRHPSAVFAAHMGLRVEFVDGRTDPGDVGMVDTVRALIPHGKIRIYAAAQCAELRNRNGA